jgi:hypothetical protein
MTVAAKMKALRMLALVLALAVAGAVLLAGAVVMTSPVAGPYLYAVFSSLRPSTIGWDAKNAWLKCEGAVAGKVDWPAAPAAACAAMHLCANEAALGLAQRASLIAAIRRLPDCSDP